MKVKILAIAFALTLSSYFAWSQITSEKSVEAAPGIPLPSRGGIYVLESGKDKQLVRLVPSEVLLNRHTGSNIAKSVFYVGSRMTLDLTGTTPKTIIHSGDISFFYRLNPDQPNLDLSRLALVKLEIVGEVRVLSALDANAFGGGAKRKYKQVDVNKQELPGEEWVKVTPIQKLEPGDYAISLFPKDPKLFPDTAFDFRIDMGK